MLTCKIHVDQVFGLYSKWDWTLQQVGLANMHVLGPASVADPGGGESGDKSPPFAGMVN